MSAGGGGGAGIARKQLLELRKDEGHLLGADVLPFFAKEVATQSLELEQRELVRFLVFVPLVERAITRS